MFFFTDIFSFSHSFNDNLAPKNMTVNRIDNTKMSLGVNEGMNVCAWCSVMDWNPTLGIFPPHVRYSHDSL